MAPMTYMTHLASFFITISLLFTLRFKRIKTYLCTLKFLVNDRCKKCDLKLW
jgi:hypothetical protein